MNKRISAIDALLSVAPKHTETVELNGVSVDIFPVSLMSVAKILRRFPEAIQVLIGEHQKPELAIVNCGPEAVAAIIAAGMGKVNDIETEVKISQLPDEWQAELLGEIVRITMPDGLEQWMGKFLAVAQKMGLVK